MKKRAIAGGRSASSVVNDAANPDSSQGISAGGMSRLVMAAIILFGSYVGMLFPVTWAAAASPTINTGLPAVQSQIKTPIKKDVLPAPSDCSEKGKPQVVPTAGIWGSFYAYGIPNQLMDGSQLNGTVVNVLNADTGALVASGENLPDTAFYSFHATFGQTVTNSQNITTLVEYVIEVQPKSGAFKSLISYFNYHDLGNSGVFYGRYSRYVASRVIMDDDCVTYAIADPESWQPGVITKALTLRNGQTRVGVRLNDHGMDMAVAFGRGLGGRLFLDDGETIHNPDNYQPPVFYNSGVSVDLYPMAAGGALTTTGSITDIKVDSEGYYSVAGINTNLAGPNPIIPGSLDKSYFLVYKKAGLDGIATMLFCNQVIPDSNNILSGNNVSGSKYPIKFTALPGGSQPSSFLDDISDPFSKTAVIDSRPPCRNKQAGLQATDTLSGSGIHGVVRQNRSIEGRVLDDNDQGLAGATVVAYRKAVAVSGGPNAAEGSAISAADGTFTIKGLRANTDYVFKTLPPPGVELVGEYYSNVELDHVLVDNDGVLTSKKTSTIAAGQPITVSLQQDIKLEQGWFFKGTVTLSNNLEPSTDVRVLVFRASDIANGNVVNLQPIDQVVAASNGNTASFTTNSILVPGESYVINFVPQGNSAEYKAGWCGVRTSGNCQFGKNSQEAIAIPITPSSGGFPARTAGIVANVTLDKGVSLKGTVGGRTAAGAATDLSNPQTPINVYVYEVGVSGSTPITSALVQYLQVIPTGSTVAYQTAALSENVYYVLRFIPSVPSGDPGYRSAYYKTGVITGVNELSAATAISRSTPGVYPNFDIELVRTGGVIFSVFTAEGLPYANVRVEGYGPGKGPGNTPAAVGVTGQDGKLELPGLLRSEGPYIFHLTPIGTRGSAKTDPIMTIDGVFISHVVTMPRFAAFSGQVTPSNENWAGTKLLVNTITGTTTTFLGLYSPDAAGTYTITKVGSVWYWDAFLPPGKYLFALVPTSTNKYLKHWYVGNSTDQAGANENLAKVAEVITSTALTGLDIGFYEGGLLRVKVEDQEGNPVKDVLVGYYTQPNFIPANLIASNSSNEAGISYSRAYSGAVHIQGVPGPTAPVITGTLLNKYIQNGQEITETLRLLPAPEITGRVRLRNANNTEVVLQNIEVELVNAFDKNEKFGSSSFTSGAFGSYRLKMPSVPFKIRFKANVAAGLPEDMYFMETPLKTGTRDFELATTLNLVSNSKLINYDLVFDKAAQPNQGCRVTDAYVLKTTTNSADIQFYSNCRGTGVVGYGFTPKPFSSTLSVYGSILFTETIVNGQETFTHTITLTGLQSDTNYYARPFVYENSSHKAYDKELLVRTSATGLNWYFPGGNISQTPLSATEILQIFNPNPQPANVTLTYYYNSNQNQNSGAITKTRQLVVNGETQVSINVHDPNQSLSLASEGFFGRHSTKISSDRQLVVERTQSIIDKNVQGYYTFGSYKLQAATMPASTSWYFPHATDNYTNTQQLISVLNSNAVTVCLKLFYYRPNSSPTNGLIMRPANNGNEGDYIVVAPNARYDFFTNDSRLGPGTGEINYALRVDVVGLAQLGCDSLPVTIESEYRYVELGSKGYEKGISALIGASAPSQRWNFVENVNDKTYDINYHIMNTYNPLAGQPSTGIVTLTAYIDNPTPGGLATTKQYTLTIKPQQRISVAGFGYLFNQPAPGQGFGYSLSIESNVPIIAARQVKYVYNNSPEQRGMYYEMGTIRAATTHIFPGNNTVSDMPRYNSSVAFSAYNPSPVAVNLKVSYYYTAQPGQQAAAPTVFDTVTLSLPAYGRTQIQPLSQGANYPGIGANKLFAIKIEAVEGTGIIVERLALYTSGNINGGGASYGYNPAGS